MPGQATSRRLTAALLAALWLGSARCGASEPPGPGCDSGKVSLDVDLDLGSVQCGAATRSEPTQTGPGLDTVYDPEPARQVCMDAPIAYNHSIPNSGAFRPVGAESGEYLYCPPQRWLNNLHHGATVLLYHPCAALRQRRRLSVLARSCLPDYILTAHPQLSEHMPIAMVSWGRTLQLSTVASTDVCDWLETTQTTREESDAVSTSRRYNLLLTWSAGRRLQEQSRKMKESLRRCCEQVLSALLRHPQLFKEGGPRRQVRAALQNDSDGQNTTTVSHLLHNRTNRNIPHRTGHVHNSSTTPGPAPDSLSDLSVAEEDPQSAIQNLNLGPAPRPTAPPRSVLSETRSQRGQPAPRPAPRPAPQTATLRPRPEPSDLRNPDLSAARDVLADSVNSAQNRSAGPEAETLRSNDSIKHKDKDFDAQSMKEKDSKERTTDDNPAAGRTDNDEVVEVKEREVEHSATHSHAGSDSAARSPSESQPAGDGQRRSSDCGGCRAGERCDCDPASGPEAPAAVVNNGLPRTPRTDEAVWAAAALGFLLVLLTLSVLHTRLYRHWRTTPSLYWHDPRQDYDSVADVIRRRLRIAKRRRKRGRRQECVLLPSSSSSDEHP
ncbi:uncharacterized protein tp53i13 [Stegastes partitus]|uniref:Uncharacterized protein tp53i13 n=1 Tax=Stegastes partitus TaxID=144197 RepID=A0A9Y4NJ09_9TELE|nr:PREDICTED: tumor protein p53-inducible protein 13 [Stegastes partitus]